MTREPANDDLIDSHVQSEAARAVVRGTLFLAVLGGVLFPLALTLWLGGQIQRWTVPAFILTWASFALTIHLLARRGWVRGAKVYAVFLPFVALPTGYLVASELFFPSPKSGLNLLGPSALIYFLFVIMTGFIFNERLSRWAGVLAGVGYFSAFLLMRRGLGSTFGDDPDAFLLFGVPIYAVRSLMLVTSGFLVGALASTSLRLIHRVIAEEREKQGISRLFGQFVSKEVKEKIIREKSALVGERKQVVVLFSDIRSFTTYSETVDPAQLVTHLNEYFDQMVGAITANGGVIDKFIGDAVMAVFGGVLELPNPAQSALAAAHQMRRNLKALNEKWAREGVRELDNGIGMHFGEVLQGTIGSAERKEFTVIGDTVNIAARLESIARDHGFPILVSAAFVAALPAAARQTGTALGSVKLKGRAQEVEVLGITSDYAEPS